MWLGLVAIVAGCTTIAAAFFKFTSIYHFVLFVAILTTVAVFTLDLIALLVYQLVMDTLHELVHEFPRRSANEKRHRCHDSVLIIVIEA
ncbi:membrane protein A20A [Aotine betaherpesvirus 1]|uniref:Membrane protein A20A n=1 Tax=Aotine betaherpesvirus 1 TaxID=50290 RepID=G8XUB5_9BETA|nr:membrane protein A20A [Aotine betaherpesvirus 1]AEV80867.1 membrane protein A20A [Aotine betaherpesvirus 1]